MASIYSLALNDQGAPKLDHGYISLPAPTNPPYNLRLEISGTSAIAHHGNLFTDIPLPGIPFQRQRYRSFPLLANLYQDSSIDLPVTCAGVFSFYIEYHQLFPLRSETKIPVKPTRTPTHYIYIAPKLKIADSIVPLNCLSVFSVVTKFMGEYPQDWFKHLKGIAARNYNMVHFTPLSQRGESNSPYSIYDQLGFDPTVFPGGESDVAEMVQRMDKELSLLSLTDVVWNHTANNSKWLESHPEAGYNVVTAPWLESAVELDTALLRYGNNLEDFGLPTHVNDLQDLDRIIDGLQNHVIEPLQLWQYYVINVEQGINDILHAWSTCSSAHSSGERIESYGQSFPEQVEYLRRSALLNASTLGPRWCRKLKSDVAAKLVTSLFGSEKESAPRDGVRQYIEKALNDLNVSLYAQFNDDVDSIKQQVRQRTKYLRLDDHGPKLGKIGQGSPLIESYFTRLPKNETTSKHDPKSLVLANNGWIWAADALKDHAGSESRAYIRREVIVWSDCVKLRYGACRDDNKFLWDYMTRYTTLMAKYFSAFRIDNCHSTPIHVAEYLLDQARAIRPDLAVFAELFTGSEEMDYVFAKRLGISALIREAMQAGSPEEMSRYVHMHAGQPFGTLRKTTPADAGSTQVVQVHKVHSTPLQALFMDCTHDNDMPAQKRDARDTLPNAALVSMCSTAIGSVMGYDEIYPRNVDVVNESRKYTSTASQGDTLSEVSNDGGICGLKKLLNGMHTRMAIEQYDEMFLHREGPYITIHRANPVTQKGYLLAARTAFPGYSGDNHQLSPIHLSCAEAKQIGAWKLSVDNSEATRKVCRDDPDYLRGLPSRVTTLETASIERDNSTTITLPAHFPPGSIAIFETWLPKSMQYNEFVSCLDIEARRAFEALDLIDLNFLLYRSEAEERDSSQGEDGVYEIPKYGKLVYAGLQGWWSVLSPIVENNDLGHPLCENLRDGHWSMDHIVVRLRNISRRENRKSLNESANWLEKHFRVTKTMPKHLVPRCFALVIEMAYNAAVGRCAELFSNKIATGTDFQQKLALTSVQMTGTTKSASLLPTESVPSLAAGLPHFAVSWARCWGRDVFISLRGLLLGTGRFDDAKSHILAFASVMKHGMVPNLLGNGESPRYNARDAVWFFLQNIQDYTKLVPNGIEILHESVSRRFLPYDDTYFDLRDPRAFSHKSTIEEIIHEALQRHATGLSFREANAGPELDMQMKSEGFDISVSVDWDTGIVFGGNQNNCGTWMDKMGESTKAGSKGIPGTPRDGAAIELTGLIYSTLTWISDLHSKNIVSKGSIRRSTGDLISFAEWAAKIKQNFDRCYYIPTSPAEDINHDINSSMINRRGIYKDLYRSGKEYEDYQFRPNFAIAMVVAPDLFPTSHAWAALTLADEVIRGPLGMATLDPSDLNYRPYYDNSNDSDDFAVSKGRNYHQGPEWVWPTGFFLRALLKFGFDRSDDPVDKLEVIAQIAQRVDACREAIDSNSWAGLPELTNKNAAYCHDSAPTQAWSTGCLIDLYLDAEHYRDQIRA